MENTHPTREVRILRPGNKEKLVQVDACMADFIRSLNAHGCWTRYCCQGDDAEKHNWNNTYIVFSAQLSSRKLKLAMQLIEAFFGHHYLHLSFDSSHNRFMVRAYRTQEDYCRAIRVLQQKGSLDG